MWQAAASQSRTYTHTDREEGRQTLSLDFTPLGWSKSLPPIFFVITNSVCVSEHGYIRTWLHVGVQQWRNVTIQVYSKSNEYNCGLGFLKSHECHKFWSFEDRPMSTKAHHAEKFGFMVVRGMPYSKIPTLKATSNECL